MTTKDILHEVLKGMCPFMSCGVPIIYWELAIKLVREIYGKKGVELMESFHEEYDGSASSDEMMLHSIDGWENGGNTRIGPLELIEKLETL